MTADRSRSSTEGPAAPDKIERRIESFRKLGEDIVVGEVRIDPQACLGCGLCAASCGGGLLELVDGVSALTGQPPLCIACGDCVAICPEGAIELAASLEFRRRYRFLNRGAPARPRRF